MPWSEMAPVGSRGKSRREDIRREKQAGGYQAGKQAGRYRVEKGEKMQVVKIPEKKQKSNHKCEKVLTIPLHKWYKMHENQMKTGIKTKICTI